MLTCARILRDATIKIRDGTSPTPNSITLQCDGGLRYRISKQGDVISHGGVLDRFAKGPEVPVKVEFHWLYEVLSWTSTTVSPYDALMRKGVAAAWVSTSDDGDVYTCEIQVTMDNPRGAGTETITFAKVRVDSIEFIEGEDGDYLFFSGTDLETEPTSVWAT